MNSCIVTSRQWLKLYVSSIKNAFHIIPWSCDLTDTSVQNILCFNIAIEVSEKELSLLRNLFKVHNPSCLHGEVSANEGREETHSTPAGGWLKSMWILLTHRQSETQRIFHLIHQMCIIPKVKMKWTWTFRGIQYQGTMQVYFQTYTTFTRTDPGEEYMYQEISSHLLSCFTSALLISLLTMGADLGPIWVIRRVRFYM